MKKKIIATVECRMTSTRLPGKVLLEAGGKPLLQILVERLRLVPQLDEIVLATTINETDDCIVKLAEKIGCQHYRGSEEDVLGRVLEAARANKADIIVEITGDCPLIDPRIISQTIDLYLKSNCDYCANCLLQTFPAGMDTQVYSTDILAIANEKGLSAPDREHVSYYIIQRPKEFTLLNLAATPELHWPELRLTLDEIADYELIKTIQENFSEKGNDYPSLAEIIGYLKENIHLTDINKNVQPKKI